jgi:methylase of polypeptide subunit release factors
VLVDANKAACALARRNADAAAIRVNVEVRHGQMTEVLAPSERFIFALADPPYVPSAETASFPGDPLLAIDGGQDGLDLARTCVEVIGAHLALEGEALLQLRDADQAERIATFIKTSPKLQLEVREVRVLGRGALVHLRREPPR